MVSYFEEGITLRIKDEIEHMPLIIKWMDVEGINKFSNFE